MVQKEPGRSPPRLVTHAVANNPDAQLATVREYAVRVFGKETTAAAWLGQVNRSVLAGRCTVAEACRTTEGFLAAMLELARLNMKNEPLRVSTPAPELLEGDPPVNPAAASDPEERPH
jgi:hypothetical protein